MGYKLLGMVVWRAAKWFLARRYGHLVPSRRAAAVGLIAVAVLSLMLVGRRAAAD